MSVVGFDVGNDTLVAAAARKRGIDVLLNAESKRESPAAVAFSHNARLIGSHAASASASHAPFSSVKRLLLGGRPGPTAQLHHDLLRLPFHVSPAAAAHWPLHRSPQAPRSRTRRCSSCSVWARIG